MKVAEWYRVEALFKLRLATLCTVNLSYEEKLQRLEELIWLRDEIKSMAEEKDYVEAATVYDSTETTKATASTGGEIKLERVEGAEWPCCETPIGGTHPQCCGGCGQGRECDTQEAREKRDIL